MTKNMTRTTLFATAFAALLFAFTTTANAQGFNANHRATPNRPAAQPTVNNRPNQPVAMPQKQTAPSFHQSTRYSPQANQPSKLQQPQRHVSHQAPKAAPIHHVKPAPTPTVCHDHHCNTQPQVVVVGQAPRKPTLLEKIVNVFR